MRNYMMAVLERHTEYSGEFQTEPFEVGWATEAIFFVHVEEVAGTGTTVSAEVQISADGIHWVDEGTRFSPMDQPGVYFLRVDQFGGWLRLRGQVKGQEGRCRVTIQLSLKE